MAKNEFYAEGASHGDVLSPIENSATSAMNRRREKS